MPKTMNKDDVLYKVDLKTTRCKVNWKQVKALTGKPTVPETARAAIDEVKAGLQRQPDGGKPLFTKPVLKVGTIGTALVFRIKDGKKHVTDVKLVRRWTPPEPVEEEEEVPEGLADYAEAKLALETLMDDAVDQFEAWFATADELEDRIEELALLSSEHPNPGHLREQAQRWLQELTVLTAEAKTHFDRTIHPAFDAHRTGYKASEYGLSKAQAKPYAYIWNQARGKYKVIKGLVDDMEQSVDHANKHLAMISRFEDTQDAGEIWAQEVAELADACATAFELMQGPVALLNLEGAAGNFQRVIGQLAEYADEPELAQNVLDNQAMKWAAIQHSVPVVARHFKAVRAIPNRIKKLPKPAKKDPRVAEQVERAKKNYEAAVRWMKQTNGYVSDAGAAYKKILAAANDMD